MGLVVGSQVGLFVASSVGAEFCSSTAVGCFGATGEVLMFCPRQILKLGELHGIALNQDLPIGVFWWFLCVFEASQKHRYL